MSEVKSSAAENFSLTRGGPFHRILVHLGRASDERRRVVNRALFATLVTWLPLLVLSLAQGVAYGSQVKIPFLRDFAVNARFLIALPIMILAESGIDQKWRMLVLEFLRSGLVNDGELLSFESVIEKTIRLRDRMLPEVVMIVLVYLSPIFLGKTELLMNGISNWHTTAAGAMTLAGWWFRLVSTPVFRFLLLRWFWRMFLWTSFLWRASRINLFLVATHTDMAAGLGFLSEGQKAFSSIVFAGGVVIAGSVGNGLAYQGATLASEKFPMIVYGVLAVIVLVVPLLVVAPALLKTKKQALIEYGRLVTKHNQLFQTRWVRQQHDPDETLLGNPDASSLADLGSSFSVVREMRLVPVTKPTLITLAVAAALPMVPVVLFATPTNEILRVVLKMLA
jgi:membrane protein YdbS with pleckstrin-like domain